MSLAFFSSRHRVARSSFSSCSLRRLWAGVSGYVWLCSTFFWSTSDDVLERRSLNDEFDADALLLDSLMPQSNSRTLSSADAEAATSECCCGTSSVKPDAPVGTSTVVCTFTTFSSLLIPHVTVRHIPSTQSTTQSHKAYHPHYTTSSVFQSHKSVTCWKGYHVKYNAKSHTTIQLATISLNYPISSRSRTLLLILSLKLPSPVISLPSCTLSTGLGSLNASNTSSSQLPTKFSQLPNRHTFITSYLFNVLAVLALHPSLLLLSHPHHPL